MLNEFKEFIAKGNVMELAVAVIIAGAFGTIVTSLTQDVIMPVVGYIFGGADFSSYFILLSAPEGYEGSMTDYAALKEAGAAMIGYGALITTAIRMTIRISLRPRPPSSRSCARLMLTTRANAWLS